MQRGYVAYVLAGLLAGVGCGLLTPYPGTPLYHRLFKLLGISRRLKAGNIVVSVAYQSCVAITLCLHALLKP